MSAAGRFGIRRAPGHEGASWWHKRAEAPSGWKAGFQEPKVVEVQDGRLLTWIRTDSGCRFQSFSEAGGDTWVEAQPGPLVLPLSPGSLKRMPGSNNLPAGGTGEGVAGGPGNVQENDLEGWYRCTVAAFADHEVVLEYWAGD